MKKLSMMLLLGSIATFSFAQDIDKILNAKEVERIERTLSADDMEGRATFTRGNDKAAAFIADEFKKAGLQTWNGGGSFLQTFSMVRTKNDLLDVTLDNVAFPAKNVILITSQAELTINQSSGYEIASIPKGATLLTETAKYRNPKKNYLVFVDTSFATNFARMQPRGASFKNDYSVVYILTSQDAKTFSVHAKNTITEQKLQNVVGVIPGKSRKNEYVIFGGHYDHLGIRGGKDRNGNLVTDSIFNGANDDAAGTTAVMMLAKYFKALNNNERTLVFAAFTAEEIGGYGSQYFSREYKPEDVKAMFNIEMIGTESQWGRNAAYITGYERTDMGKILQANLEGTGFTFHPDPYTTQNLFFRSDNATLAYLGVPAHTICTAKMENPPEPNYHKASDEIGTLDMENMAMIIKAIAISSKGIISGKETPSRVDVSNLARPGR